MKFQLIKEFLFMFVNLELIPSLLLLICSSDSGASKEIDLLNVIRLPKDTGVDFTAGPDGYPVYEVSQKGAYSALWLYLSVFSYPTSPPYHYPSVRLTDNPWRSLYTPLSLFLFFIKLISGNQSSSHLVYNSSFILSTFFFLCFSLVWFQLRGVKSQVLINLYKAFCLNYPFL